MDAPTRRAWSRALIRKNVAIAFLGGNPAEVQPDVVNDSLERRDKKTRGGDDIKERRDQSPRGFRIAERRTLDHGKDPDSLGDRQH